MFYYAANDHKVEASGVWNCILHVSGYSLSLGGEVWKAYMEKTG